jgi:hypothetical protein
MSQLIKGRYHDTLTSSQSHARWDSGWRSNLIVHQCNRLLATLMKGRRGIRGILFWAIGEGAKDWDGLCPSPHPADTQLHKEIVRQRLKASQIVYLDDAGIPSGTPTNCLEITAAFKGKDLVSNGFQPLREFGLFGGNATEETDSGFMIDYVIHPRIDLAPGNTLERKLRLTFAAGAAQQDEVLTEFGADLPVSSIDGVGSVYSSTLNAHGIHSLGDLAAIAPQHSIGGIPPGRLREFRAKARLAMRLQVSPDRLQEAMGDLQIALDDAQLRSIKLEGLSKA